MDINMQTALVGVFGTLAGTVLGWVLNNISQNGKLNIYIYNWDIEFQMHELGSLTESDSIEETEYFSYSFNADIYNSSAETKIMRDIKVEFYQGDILLKKFTPHDKSTMRKSTHRWVSDELPFINVPPKTVISVELTNGEWIRDIKDPYIWNVNRIMLTYKDEKNESKEIYVAGTSIKEIFKLKKEIKNGQA